jgi:hypothetical protein
VIVSQAGNLYTDMERLLEAILTVPLEGRKEGRKKGKKGRKEDAILYLEKFGDYKS